MPEQSLLLSHSVVQSPFGGPPLVNDAVSGSKHLSPLPQLESSLHAAPSSSLASAGGPASGIVTAVPAEPAMDGTEPPSESAVPSTLASGVCSSGWVPRRSSLPHPGTLTTRTPVTAAKTIHPHLLRTIFLRREAKRALQESNVLGRASAEQGRFVAPKPRRPDVPKATARSSSAKPARFALAYPLNVTGAHRR
jgi:hypothetical protein